MDRNDPHPSKTILKEEAQKVYQNQSGQLTIFLAVTLVIVITMIAFIVNVGLFVKFKINLQNAADSAAWSGAAVQSRQLTQIAHLNWELRNTYKEYLFKMYVLGQLGLESKIGLPNGSPTSGSDVMDFRMKQFFDPADPDGASLGSSPVDPYNLPSTCIHFGSEHNICAIYDVPGLPRFGTVGLPSISPHHEAFLNSIAETKSSNCSRRSDINFGVAMVWAYGTGSNLFEDSPQIAANRVGAWPQALELAIRIRNLEYLVNSPPKEGSICFSSSPHSCSVRVDTLGNNTNYPINERTVKAFMAAYRNLGGGIKKEAPEDQNPFSANFRMYELKPQEAEPGTNTLSGFLIPQGKNKKYYLDLQVWPVNLVGFFTNFITETGTASSGSQIAGRNAEAACKGSKSAIPIPAYITGFTKNPKFITYYPIKVETEFLGMFFPFVTEGGITISAYAAAKPFGGRIGPMLFSTSDNQSVIARSGVVNKSGPYAATLEVNSTFKPGSPVPTSPDFFATPSDPFGGTATDSTNVKYIIPNLLYDAISLDQQSASTLSILKKATSPSVYSSPEDGLGLYKKDQFIAFKNNLVGPSGVVYTQQEIEESIANVRAPTTYEALNYLIPTVDNVNSQSQLAHPHTTFAVPGGVSGNILQYQLYGPIIAQGALYNEIGDISRVVDDFLGFNSSSAETYIEALKAVSDEILAQAGQSVGGTETYRKAADTIYNTSRAPGIDPSDCSNVSMADKFQYFFEQNASGDRCGVIPLSELMRNYIDSNLNTGGANNQFRYFYSSSYRHLSPGDNEDFKQVMTGYRPGQEYSVGTDGNIQNLLDGSGTDRFDFRNSYSTKLVPVEAFTNSSGGYYDKQVFGEFEEFGQEDDSVDRSSLNSNYLNDTVLIQEFEGGPEGFDF